MLPPIVAMAQRVFPIFVIALTSIADLPSASADDWPQWRGANRDSVSGDTGLLQQWPAGGPPLTWRIEGLGGWR